MIMVHDPLDNDETAPGQGERVAKALARAGVASRREVERLIGEGRVALNGEVLTTPAIKVEVGDILTVDGEVVNEAEPTRLFRYHKPIDLLTTHNDPQGRPTVFEALPPGLPRLISVGRLDINSEGLLLLTNDGELARALEQPSTGLVRRYRVRARGRISQAELDKLQDGITVEGVRYGAIDAKIDKAKEGPQGANIWMTVILAEGKNREIRRVMQALGLSVSRLIRMSYGPFALGTLEVGHIEEVGPRVIREQLAEHIAPENLPKGDRPQFTAKRPPPGSHAVHDGTGRRGASPTGEVEPRQKLTYKAGWATPKIAPSPHAAKPRKPRPVVERRAPVEGDAPLAPRPRSSRLANDKPGGIRTFTPGQPPPRTDGPRSPKSGFAKPKRHSTLIERGPRTADPKRPRTAAGGSSRSDDRPSKPRAPKSFSAPRDFAPRSDSSVSPRPEGRPTGPRGPRPSGPRSDAAPRSYAGGAPRPDARPTGPRGPNPSSGPGDFAPRSDSPRPEGRPTRPRGPSGPRSDTAPRSYSGGAPRSDARPTGPRGPKPSSGPRDFAPRSNSPRPEGRATGPRGPKPSGPRSDSAPGSYAGGAPRSGPSDSRGPKPFSRPGADAGPRGPKPSGPRGPKPFSGPRSDSPRPQSSGSSRPEGRPTGPRGPKPSGPRSGGDARPQGRPPSGGPKRRG
jgi:23S rRNA pseudouridine2605 synthase